MSRTCPSCGAEVADDMAFCGNCGTKMPTTKNCIFCGKELPLSMNFCGFCGKSQTGGGAAQGGASGGFSMGDKNVIAGDVIGSKEETHIAGNATIIKNEDETKKMTICHVCGKNLPISLVFTCSKCGQHTCENCFDSNKNCCKPCASSSENEKENLYKQTLTRVLSDDRIEMSERRELIELQKQLGLSDQRAQELEQIVRSELNAGKSTDLSTVDSLNFNKAKELFYNDGDISQSKPIFEDLYNKYPVNEAVIAAYYDILLETDIPKLREILNSLRADILAGYLAEIDIAFIDKDYSKAEAILGKAAKFWPDSILLACRQVQFYICLADIGKDPSYLAKAEEVLANCKETDDKLEKSWLYVARHLLKEVNQNSTEITSELDSEQNLYKALILSKDFIAATNFLYNDNYPNLRFFLASHFANQKMGAGYFALALCYFSGFGVEKNKNLASDYLHKAGDVNFPEAIEALVDVYRYGDDDLGIESDADKAMYWCNKGIDSNCPSSVLTLAKVYEYGDNNFERLADLEQAKHLYNKYAELDSYNGYCYLGDFYLNHKDEGPVSLAIKALQNSCENHPIIDFYKKAIEAGNLFYGTLQLGKLYKYGLEGVCTKNINEAIKYFEMGINIPYINTQLISEYAGIYATGDFGIAKDSAKAIEILDKDTTNEPVLRYLKAMTLIQEYSGDSAKISEGIALMNKVIEDNPNFNDAIKFMANEYMTGVNVPKDIAKGTALYERAFNNGDVDAMSDLGYLYLNNPNVEHDAAKAKEYLTKAADLNNPRALTNLAIIYEIGDGVPVDLSKAKDYLKRAGDYQPARDEFAKIVLAEAEELQKKEEEKKKKAEEKKKAESEIDKLYPNKSVSVSLQSPNSWSSDCKGTRSWVTITFKSKRVNNDSAWHSRKLKLIFWFATEPYNNGIKTGYEMGELIITDEGLKGGYGWSDFERVLSVTGNPPTGDYHVIVTVNEYHEIDKKWYIVGHTDFDGTRHWNHQ